MKALRAFDHLPISFPQGSRLSWPGFCEKVKKSGPDQRGPFRPLKVALRSAGAANAFLMERDVYLELGYIRDDFSFLCTVITEAYGPNFFSYITRHSQDIELRKKYRIVSAEGYPLYDSTLREAFNAPYILASLERALSETEGQDKDVKSDLIAYESLKAKCEAELEELYKRPFEDIAVEEFLDQLPKPQIEEVEEPVPMDTAEAPQENATSSALDAEAGDLPQGKMPDPAEATTPDVPWRLKLRKALHRERHLG